MSIRAERVADEIQKILSLPLANYAKEKNAGILTITEVKMSPDLSIAKVYFSLYGSRFSPQTFLNLLEEDKSQFRRLVGANIRLRQTPELRFFYDDTFDKIERIEKILRESQDKENPDEGK